MPPNTRYDQLARLIRRDFEKAQTLTNDSLSANESDILVNADSEDWRSNNSTFAQYRPYNTVTVDNTSGEDVQVFLDRNQNLWMTVEAGEARTLDADFYFTFVEVENQSGSNTIAADDVEVTVGRMVNSRELRLLEMAGQLNIGDSR